MDSCGWGTVLHHSRRSGSSGAGRRLAPARADAPPRPVWPDPPTRPSGAAGGTPRRLGPASRLAAPRALAPASVRLQCAPASSGGLSRRERPWAPPARAPVGQRGKRSSRGGVRHL